MNKQQIVNGDDSTQLMRLTFYACHYDNADGLRELLNNRIMLRLEWLMWKLFNVNVGINAKMRDGTTALMIASSQFGRVDVVKLLLDVKADVNQKNQKGCTALMIASQGAGVFGSRIDLVEVLLLAGADVNLKDNSGQTAITLASKYGHVDVVKLLLDQADTKND